MILSFKLTFSLCFISKSAHGITVGHRWSFEEMVAFIQKEQIKPVIDTIYTFNKVRDAFRQLSVGAFGKIIVKI